MKERGLEGPGRGAAGEGVPLAPCHDGDGGQNAHLEISLLSLAGSLGTLLLFPRPALTFTWRKFAALPGPLLARLKVELIFSPPQPPATSKDKPPGPFPNFRALPVTPGNRQVGNVRPHSHDGPPAHQLGPLGFSIPLHLPSEVGYARVSSEALHHSGTDTGRKAESLPPPWQRPGQGRDQTGPGGDLTSIHSQAAVTMYCHRWASATEIRCAQFCR